MKYVAFLDMLGFKNKLRRIRQDEAKRLIGDFSSTIYAVFRSDRPFLLHGYIVSDCMILYTEDTSSDSLLALIDMVGEICRREFSENGILIRGAVAKGEFDEVPAAELANLQKQLIVGNAYIEAYLLEDAVKTIGINLSEKVYQDLQNCEREFDIIPQKIRNEMYYILRYISVDYLLEKQNMRRFVELAAGGEWLPHYYNALYFALKGESGHAKVEELFTGILTIINKGAPSEHWRELDIFIKNSFHEEVFEDYKRRFLKFLRKKLVGQTAPKISEKESSGSLPSL